MGAPLEHDDDLASIHELTDYGEDTSSPKVILGKIHWALFDDISYRNVGTDRTGIQWSVSPIATNGFYKQTCAI